MKKLFVLMLCAMLAVPSVNMSVQAAETQPMTEEQKEQDTGKEAKTSNDNQNNGETPEPTAVNSNVIIGGKEYDTAIANAGAECTIAVPLVNLGETDVTNVVITPVLSEDVKSWPFEISKTDYSQTWEDLPGEKTANIPGKEITMEKRKHTFRWTLKTRKDAVTGYTKLTFNVSYNEEDGSKGSVALDYYVQVNGVTPTEETVPEET